jgi:hypothetical protein
MQMMRNEVNVTDISHELLAISKVNVTDISHELLAISDVLANGRRKLGDFFGYHILC